MLSTTRVAGMFAARGFNIDSLVVGRTEDPQLSRMTIVVIGDDRVLEQVRKQLAKIVPVVKVQDFAGQSVVARDRLTLIGDRRAVPGIHHGAIDFLRQQLDRARRMVPHDDDVGPHGVERHRGTQNDRRGFEKRTDRNFIWF